MNEQPVTGSESDFCRGSAWAALDETFFRLTQDVFTHVVNEGATALLASHDEIGQDEPDRAAARRAAMRRHPSSRRRF